MSVLIAPSLLAADWTRLSEELKRVETMDLLHLDIMDGHFVSNISFGPGLVKTIRPLTPKPFDVHLMIENPDRYVRVFAESGANSITFHWEAFKTDQAVHGLITLVKSLGKKVGLSIKPRTPVESLIPFLKEIDLVLVMSVEPGFGGQEFLTDAITRIRYLHHYKAVHQLGFEIEVDGGINVETAQACRIAGATILVAGTAIFKSADPARLIKELKGEK